MQMIAIPKFAVHMAHMVAQLTPQVTIYTNGNVQIAQEVMAMSSDRPPWKVDTRVIKSLKKDAEAGIEIYLRTAVIRRNRFSGIVLLLTLMVRLLSSSDWSSRVRGTTMLCPRFPRQVFRGCTQLETA